MGKTLYPSSWNISAPTSGDSPPITQLQRIWYLPLAPRHTANFPQPLPPPLTQINFFLIKTCEDILQTFSVHPILHSLLRQDHPCLVSNGGKQTFSRPKQDFKDKYQLIPSSTLELLNHKVKLPFGSQGAELR